MNMPIITQFGSAEQSMTSLEIAELVQKRHDNVKRTIENLVQSSVIAQPQIEDGIKASNGVIPKLYIFTGEQGKRDSIVVVAQLCPEFTARLVDRWAELEKQAQSTAFALPNFANPAEAARAWAEQFEAKQLAEKQIAVLAPKAQALDAIANTKNTHCIREVAKTIGIKQSDLIDLLIAKKWVYRDSDKKLQPYAEYVTKGIFLNRASPVIKNHNDGKERVFLHMRVTAFGLTRITGLVNKLKGVAK